jgi:DNA-binding SARP family transcriptional activator/tetratricopeptide (TPR) repeat protein
VEFRVLGPLEVLDRARSLQLGGAKQRALLALLVLNANRVVSRDRLVDALWGEDPPETAVTTVQVYVSRLRKVLGPKTLVTRTPGYLLHVAPGCLDLDQFERLRAAGRPGQALALWRGPPLAEFTEPFARTEAARLEDLRLAALEERIELDLAQAKHADLIGELQGLIAEHPHRERLRGQLMLALYRSGRQTEALEAFRDARASLDELGIAPREELRRLERSILTQDAALTARPQLVPDAPGLPGPLAARPSTPFVGRESELTTLRSLLQRAEAGEGQVALLGGEAGSGKSRLARELAQEATESGALVLYGSCDPIVDAPYQPFVEALQFLVRVSDPDALESCMPGSRGELARLMPSLGATPTDAGADHESARQRLHAAVVDLLANVCRARTLLVIVDDVHWADAPSLHLLRDVARTAPEARLFFLATHRDRSEDMRPEFSESHAALLRLDGVSRLTVGALGEEDVVEFIRDSTGERQADVSDAASAIHGLTDGNAFLLAELWRALVDEDVVESRDGVLRLTHPLADLASPRAVREVAQYRLSRLGGPTTGMLEVAAVAGSTFELKVIEQAVNDVTLVPSLEEALTSGTIEEVPGPRLSYRFSHELVRRALYDRLSRLRRVQLHLRIGEALDRMHAGADDQVVSELAHHFTVAASLGGRERAMDYNLRAADAALALLAFEQAKTFASTAIELARQDEAAWARAHHSLATAEFELGQGGAAAHAAVAAVAFEALHDDEAAADAHVLASRSLRSLGRGEEANAAARRAVEMIGDGPPSRTKARVLVWWASMLNLHHGRFREALECARAALTVAEELDLIPSRVAALNQIGSALGNLGEGGDSELEQAVELVRGGRAPSESMAAYGNLGARRMAQGRGCESVELQAEGRAAAERLGLLDAVQFHAAQLASGAFILGDWKRAEELFDEYLDLIANSPTRGMSIFVTNTQATIARARGNHTAALEQARRGLSLARGVKQTQTIGRGLAVLALVLVEQGRPDGAGPLVDELLALTDETGRALWFRWMIDLGWLLHDLDRPEPLPLSRYPVWNGPAQAIANGDLPSAVDLLAATDLVTEEMYARLRAGEQLAAAGRHAEAEPHLEHAAAFYRSVGGTAYLERALAATRAEVQT